jgi:hypothetical protein
MGEVNDISGAIPDNSNVNVSPNGLPSLEDILERLDGTQEPEPRRVQDDPEPETEEEDSIEEPIESEDLEGEAGEDSEDVEEEDEEETEDEPGGAGSSAIKQMQKRINKLTARAKSAEEKLSQLEAQKAVGSESESKSNDNSLDKVFDINQLQEHREKARKAMNFARNHRDGYYSEDDDGNPIEYTADQMASILNGAEKVYHEDIPEREKYLKNFEAAKVEASKAYPYLGDATSPEFKQGQQYISEFPDILKRSDWPVVLGDLIAGRKLRLAKQKPVTATKPKPSNPPTTPGKPSAVPVQPTRKQKGRQVIDRAINNPTAENLADFLDAVGI